MLCGQPVPVLLTISHFSVFFSFSAKKAHTWFNSLPRYCSILFFNVFHNCRSLTKVKFSSDQVRRALGSGGCLSFVVTMLKNLKTAFQPDTQILSALTALYWPSTAFYWPSTTKYQPVPPYTDPVPSWINHHRLILIHCHHVPTSRAPYWPSTIMYQPVPPSIGPVPLYINQYHSILTQYHQVSTSINLYCCCMGITDVCTVYPGSFLSL